MDIQVESQGSLSPVSIFDEETRFPSGFGMASAKSCVSLIIAPAAKGERICYNAAAWSNFFPKVLQVL